MGIIKPPIGKFQTELEHIPQEHFVKKSSKQAVTKHIVKESDHPIVDNFKIGNNEFQITNTPQMSAPTSSFNPNTFQISTSYQSVLDAIENGKDTDLVAMPVGEVRMMQERIKILEKEVMKSFSPKSAQEKHTAMMLEMERERIKAEQKRIQWEYEHKRATDLKKEEIKRQIAMSKGWDKMFDS